MSDRIPQELLSALIDGELTAAEQTELVRRLEASVELQEELAALREVSQQVRMLARPYAPPELRSNVIEQIQRKRTPAPDSVSRSRRGWKLKSPVRWAAVVTAASLLILAAWSLVPRDAAPPALAINDHQPDGFSEIELSAARDSIPKMAASEGQTSPVAPSAVMSPAPRSEEGNPAPVESVQVVNVSPEEIRRRIDDLGIRPQQGNSIRVPGSLQENDSETPIIVVFTVVDVIEAMNQMQVLVRQQQVRSTDNHVLITPSNEKDRSLTAVTVELEMDGPKMAALLNTVEAFDAVMYVEQNLSSSRDLKTESSAAAPSLGVAPQSLPRVARSQDRSAQRQFNFQQLAEESITEQSGADDVRVAGGMPRKRGDLNESDASIRERPLPMTKAGPVPSPLAAPVASPQSLPSSSWEDARRFRAFILLKKQPESARSPVREAPEGVRPGSSAK